MSSPPRLRGVAPSVLAEAAVPLAQTGIGGPVYTGHFGPAHVHLEGAVVANRAGIVFAHNGVVARLEENPEMALLIRLERGDNAIAPLHEKRHVGDGRRTRFALAEWTTPCRTSRND